MLHNLLFQSAHHPGQVHALLAQGADNLRISHRNASSCNINNQDDNRLTQPTEQGRGGGCYMIPHLYGMATAWSELLAEGPRRPVQPEAWMDRLIEAELADRQVRSLRYQLKAARFPVHRDLTGIDWAETPLPKAEIETLATAAFMQRRRT